MPPVPSKFHALTSFALLALLSVAVAHGHDDDMSMDMDMGASAAAPAGTAAPASAEIDSYFRYGEHSGLMTAHILLMSIAWVFILPIGVLLSVARSRFSLPVQFFFLIVNAIGVALVTIYNASTPDFYPDNAHHKLGWIVTWIMTAQVAMGVIRVYAERKDGYSSLPVSQEAMAAHHRILDQGRFDPYRFSNDSGHGTASRPESLRSQSRSEDDRNHADSREEPEDDGEEKQGLMHGSRVDKYLAMKIPGLLSARVMSVLRFFSNVIDRTILLLGFAALTTGGVTYGGIFKGHEIFSGLAHFIKGGVFFWYGILTLGRWAGCFAEIGWAWNIRPTQDIVGSKKRAPPTAEFVESFLIFFYGSTNVFLEHLGSWGGDWSAQDLEHLSITIMFFGGGLCGMLIESKRIRELLNATKQPATDLPLSNEREALEEPKTYKFSMNPIPALVVLLLGLMMSSHKQESMVSSMIHKQWGTLLTGAAFARAATYVVFYLSPPSSIFPGRPPTELITAFCLMAGGMIFMASSHDTVKAMEMNNLDAMFIFTVSMGFITFLMAWILMAIAIKGWAVKRERKI